MATYSTAYTNAALDGGNALVVSVAVLNGTTEIARNSVTVPAASGGSATLVTTFTILAGSTLTDAEAYDASNNVVRSDVLPNGGATYNVDGTYELTMVFEG